MRIGETRIRLARESFPNRLEGLRKGQKMTQNELADATGINRKTLSRYEAGDMLPSADKLLVLAEFFGVRVDWLLGGKEW